MGWVCLRANGNVVDRFRAPADHGKALRVALEKFGPGVEKVLSAADWHEWVHEQAVLERNKRLRAEHRVA